jgi:hypothetical protein
MQDVQTPLNSHESGHPSTLPYPTRRDEIPTLHRTHAWEELRQAGTSAADRFPCPGRKRLSDEV